MTAILFITGFFVFFIFRSNWKKSVYLLILMIPFFGFIQLKIIHLTAAAALIQDLTVIIPLYVLFILDRIKNRNNQFYLPGYFINFLIFFVLLIIVFTINPFFETSLFGRLVGAKIWIFYLLFILIGFEFIGNNNELELKKFCNFFAIVTIIPCVVGILQYLGSYFVDFRTAMTVFYGGNAELAAMSTQNFAVFDWGSGVKVFRLPSTFSFSAQFHVFTLAAMVPAIAAVGFAETNKEKYFYSMIVVLIILAAYSSGARATTINFLLFFTFLILLQTRFYIVLLLSVLVFITISFINIESIPILGNIISGVKDITTFNLGVGEYAETEGYLFIKYGDLFKNFFIGEGVGSATPENRYVWGGTGTGEFKGVHESYYHKAFVELGVFGFLVCMAFLAIIIYEIILAIRSLRKDNRASLFCSALLALYLLSIINVLKASTLYVKYPSNFLLYFYLGIVIKLRFIALNNEQNQ